MRQNSGRASIPFQLSGKPPTPVVLADALALLSGVNFGSIEKVIAALEAIAEATGMDMTALLKLEDVPLQRTVLGSRGDATRADATGAFCRTVSAVTERIDIEETLRLRARFPYQVRLAPETLRQ